MERNKALVRHLFAVSLALFVIFTFTACGSGGGGEGSAAKGPSLEIVWPEIDESGGQTQMADQTATVQTE